ncbi:hypothetical protein BCR42DRAFT_411945, partial [Absidia repens]
MSKINNPIHPLDTRHAHSPPRIENAPPPKKLKKPSKSTSLPLTIPSSSLSSLPSQPVNIPIPTQSYSLKQQQQQQLPLSNIYTNSCPPLTNSSSNSLTTSPVISALYSLPEFKVGSLPHPSLPSAVWPVTMVNDFLTPPSNRSFSFSDPSSSSSSTSSSNDHQLVFDMD